MATTHTLKTHHKFIAAIASGRKKFEIRLNDRNFKVHDNLVLRGWRTENSIYTGQVVTCRVTSLLSDPDYGVQKGFVVMSIKLLKIKLI